MNSMSSGQKLKNLLTQLELDAVVILDNANLRYLCGFTGTDGALVATSETLSFLTDSRYTIQARDEVCAESISEYKAKIEAIVDNLASLGAEKIGYETTLPVGLFEELQDKGGDHWRWVNLKQSLQPLRMHKTTSEVACIESAAQYNAIVSEHIIECIRPGMREIDVAISLEYELRKLGAEEKAFDMIVASGTRGALPHGIASEKTIAEGELVTVDFGCRVSGYHSDETVTVAIGPIDNEYRKVFDTVLEAHDLAIQAVTPGLALSDLDHIARAHIEKSGYGEYFGHGLGHGVGLEVHEAPVVSPRSKSIAEEGMVFTIEPGIYVPGLGGVRIEDMVQVTADGCRVLTKIPKTFRNILLN